MEKWEHGKTGTQEHGKIGKQDHGKTGKRENRKMGTWEHGNTGTRENRRKKTRYTTCSYSVYMAYPVIHSTIIVKFVTKDVHMLLLKTRNRKTKTWEHCYRNTGTREHGKSLKIWPNYSMYSREHKQSIHWIKQNHRSITTAH